MLEPILAHAIGGRTDLPVPLAYFVVGASLVLIVSFGALSALWTRPRLQGVVDASETPLRAPRPLLAGIGLLGLLLVAGQVVVPLLGLETDPTRPTIAPVLVWVCFWLVVPFLSAVVGNWYADINPWRTSSRSLRLGQKEVPGLVGRLGLWPAAGAFLALAWFELISPSSGDPVTLGWVAIAYTVSLLALIGLTGRETALTSFDLFTGYNRLFSAISPLGRRGDGRLVWRGWLRALTVVPQWRGLWAFVVVMLGTVTFDGASGAEWFVSLTGPLTRSPLGQTVAMLMTVGVIGLGYWGACALAARLGGAGARTAVVAQRFAHTLVPIALAYAFAHYFTLVVFEGQQLIAALSDPFGLGWDLFGTADNRISFWVTTTAPIWYVQVGSIVGGHVLGVVLAHDRALADFGAGAARSQYAMLLLMIGLTSLGLLVLAG
jgi:hypothetical protein